MADLSDYPGRYGRTAEVETEWGEVLVLRELSAGEALKFWPQFLELEDASKQINEPPPLVPYAMIVQRGAVLHDFQPRWDSVDAVLEMPARIIAQLGDQILALSEIGLEDPEKKDPHRAVGE